MLDPDDEAFRDVDNDEFCEFYAELWHKALREKSLFRAAPGRPGYWMHDILGSYGTEECNVQLALYATDEKRARHTEQFPDRPLPEKRARLTRRAWRAAGAVLKR